MSIWLERFVLTLLAALAGATVLTNPWHLDRFQQFTLIVAIVALSLFAARTIERARTSSVGLLVDSEGVQATSSASNERPAVQPPNPPGNAPSHPSAGAEERRNLQTPSQVARGIVPTPQVETISPAQRSTQQPVPSPDLIVDDFIVLDTTLRARMKLKNYGNAGGEVQLRIESFLAGTPMLVTGERPDVVLIPAGSTKTLDFGPLSPEYATTITSGQKAFEIVVEAGFGAGYKEHGYRYRGMYDVSRGQFNLLEEKRW